MALVYVHGIGNWDRARFDAAARARDELFRRFLLPVTSAHADRAWIGNPFWGDLVGPRRPRLVTHPDRMGTLGADVDEQLAEVVVGREPDRVLLSLAAGSLRDAVDALYMALGPEADDPTVAPDLAVRLATYCDIQEALHPDGPETMRYPWLVELGDDGAFVDRLLAEVDLATGNSRPRTLGGSGRLRDWLAAAVRRLRTVAVACVTGPLAGAVRSLGGARLALLFGDVVGYLAHRGNPTAPGPVVTAVAGALDEARARTQPGDRLVVVAHSMGGNIVHDVLTSFYPGLEVDVLVTVGSQVGLFEELQLFHHGAYQPAGRSWSVAPALTNVGRWINVIDPADVLSYRIAPVIDGVEDYAYPSGAAWAHTAYLRQPNFHARLARKLAAPR